MKAIRKLLQGIGLIPVPTTAVDAMGEAEVLSSNGKLNYHNGTSASPVVTEAHSSTLTNKSIDADTNTITNIENADIKAAAAIAVNKLAAVTASRAVASDASGFLTASATTSTELGYVSGVTSAIQTQIDAKASSTLTDAHILVGNVSNVASDVAVSGDISITNAGVTAIVAGVVVNADINASAAIDASKIADGSVSSTEFQYLSGVTSDIQDQIDGKASSTLTSANILVGNVSNVAAAVAVTGDISLSNAGVTAYATTVPLNKGGTGQTTKAAAFDALSPMTTSGDIIYGGASGTGTRLAKATNGDVLTLVAGIPAWQANGATTGNVEVFTSSDTFVIPSGVNRLFISGAGGGGGGGAGSQDFGSGGRGGSGGGGSAIGTSIIDVSAYPGDTLTITIGAAGTGGVAQAGNAASGGDTIVVTSGAVELIRIRGGAGGTAAAGTSSGIGLGGDGGSGGAASAAGTNGTRSYCSYINGTPGVNSGNGGGGGSGGAGFNGNGGNGGNGGSPAVTPTAPTGYGAGGGGGGGGQTGGLGLGATGAAGGAGVLVIAY